MITAETEARDAPNRDQNKQNAEKTSHNPDQLSQFNIRHPRPRFKILEAGETSQRLFHKSRNHYQNHGLHKKQQQAQNQLRPRSKRRTKILLQLQLRPQLQKLVVEQCLGLRGLLPRHLQSRLLSSLYLLSQSTYRLHHLHSLNQLQLPCRQSRKSLNLLPRPQATPLRLKFLWQTRRQSRQSPSESLLQPMLLPLQQEVSGV